MGPTPNAPPRSVVPTSRGGWLFPCCRRSPARSAPTVRQPPPPVPAVVHAEIDGDGGGPFGEDLRRGPARPAARGVTADAGVVKHHVPRGESRDEVVLDEGGVAVLPGDAVAQEDDAVLGLEEELVGADRGRGREGDGGGKEQTGETAGGTGGAHAARGDRRGGGTPMRGSARVVRRAEGHGPARDRRWDGDDRRTPVEKLKPRPAGDGLRPKGPTGVAAESSRNRPPTT